MFLLRPNAPANLQANHISAERSEAISSSLVRFSVRKAVAGSSGVRLRL